MVNTSNAEHAATLTVYSQSGAVAGMREVSLNANQAQRIRITDIAKDAGAIQLDQENAGSQLLWNVTAQQPEVNDALLAGITAISPTPLEPSRQNIVSILDDRVIR